MSLKEYWDMVNDLVKYIGTKDYDLTSRKIDNAINVLMNQHDLSYDEFNELMRTVSWISLEAHRLRP